MTKPTRDQIAQALAKSAGWDWGRADRRKWRIRADAVVALLGTMPTASRAWAEGWVARDDTKCLVLDNPYRQTES